MLVLNITTSSRRFKRNKETKKKENKKRKKKKKKTNLIQKQQQQPQKQQPGHTLTTKKLTALAKAENAHNQMVKAIQNKNLVTAMLYHKEAVAVSSESRLLNFLKVFFFFF